MALIFGLTGGIACGKSTVTKTFRAHGIPMVDADVVARQVVEPGTVGLEALTQTFGKEYLLPDGTLNRTALGRLVFSDASALKKINQIVGPLIKFEGSRQIANLFLEGHDIIGYDAALLIELGSYEGFKYLILVSCPADIQLARLMGRNNLTREEAQARIDAQLPLETKMKLVRECRPDTHFIVDTSGRVEHSVEQTEKIIKHFHEVNHA